MVRVVDRGGAEEVGDEGVGAEDGEDMVVEVQR